MKKQEKDKIVLWGMNHNTAPIEIREKWAIGTRDRIKKALVALKAGNEVHEALILSTCNRAEFYLVGNSTDQLLTALKDSAAENLNLNFDDYARHFYHLEEESAVAHLFRVATGVDSMMIGEPQILGQVKEAYLLALEAGTTGNLLNSLCHRAIRVGKKARAETSIGRGALSIPYAAVIMARKIFGRLNDKTVAVLGSGKMGQLTARQISNAGARQLLIVARRMEKAYELAETLGGKATIFDPDLNFLVRSDILISSTASPRYLIRRDEVKEVMARRRHRVLFLIDIALPRDVEPSVNELPNVYLYNIDDLQEVVKQSLKEREKEAEKVEKIIRDEAKKFGIWLETLKSAPVITAFRQLLEELRTEQWNDLIKGLNGLTPQQREKIEYFSRSLINKIFHRPARRLKQLDDDHLRQLYSQLLSDLFDLTIDNNSSDPPNKD